MTQTENKQGRKFSFDEKCYELAEYFYPEAATQRLNELAQRIQDVIEDDWNEL
jgi:hypothetical protein